MNSNLKFHDAGKTLKQISFSRRTSENKNLLHTNKRKQKPSYPLLKAIAVSFQALKFPEISTLVCLSLLLFTRCFACHGNYSLGPLLSKPKSLLIRRHPYKPRYGPLSTLNSDKCKVLNDSSGPHRECGCQCGCPARPNR